MKLSLLHESHDFASIGPYFKISENFAKRGLWGHRGIKRALFFTSTITTTTATTLITTTNTTTATITTTTKARLKCVNFSEVLWKTLCLRFSNRNSYCRTCLKLKLDSPLEIYVNRRSNDGSGFNFKQTWRSEFLFKLPLRWGSNFWKISKKF